MPKPNPVQTDQQVIYEISTEDMEEMILDNLKLKLGKDLPFHPNKVLVQCSDPGNGVYQIRIMYDQTLPQLLPLRGPGNAS